MSTECCDVIVAHSPPLFTGHRNAQPNLPVCIYDNFRLGLVMTQKQSPIPVRRFVNNNSRHTSNRSPTRSADSKLMQSWQQEQGSQHSPKPRRPCLVTRTDSDCSIGSSSSGSSSEENEPPSPTRRKKKVVFADDRGFSLTQVRLMKEPSNQPPKMLTVGQYLPSAVPVACAGGTLNKHMADQLWLLRFSQPASNYLDFRHRLDTSNISLENVIVKSPDHRIVGTVKVRNLSYDKEVFVRCTEDKWATSCDAQCTYVKQNTAAMNTHGSCSVAQAPVQNIYDTFSFSLQLPTKATNMEFAVCYKSTEFECWDNNEGNNYCVSVTGNNVPLLQQMQEQNSTAVLSPSQVANGCPVDHHLHQKSPVIHFFGAQSKQNSWTTWRDQKIDNSAYW